MEPTDRRYTFGEFRRILCRVQALEAESLSLMKNLEEWYSAEPGSKPVRAAEVAVSSLVVLEKILRKQPLPRTDNERLVQDLLNRISRRAS